jgi:hypothetical protein
MVECQPEGPFTLRPVAPEERDGFRLHLQRYHYLGFKRSAGESMGYAAFVGQELVALLDWGAAVLRCLPRDEHVGWDDRVRERNLSLVVGNRRPSSSCRGSRAPTAGFPRRLAPPSHAHAGHTKKNDPRSFLERGPSFEESASAGDQGQSTWIEKVPEEDAIVDALVAGDEDLPSTTMK